jgi:hypothetical protein
MPRITIQSHHRMLPYIHDGCLRPQQALKEGMTGDSMMGRYFKIAWFCALAGWLSLVAYGRIATAPAGSHTASIERLVSPATGAFTHSSRVEQPPGDTAKAVSPDLSVYLQLHETRDLPTRTVPASRNMCSS